VIRIREGGSRASQDKDITDGIEIISIGACIGGCHYMERELCLALGVFVIDLGWFSMDVGKEEQLGRGVW
jgi:hypothetical protein